MTEARQAVEAAARNSYGRLIAFLAARARNVAAAEDALGDALRAALETWSRDGVPQKPEAWLLTTARRRLIDQGRRQAVEMAAQPSLLSLLDEAVEMTGDDAVFPDERLKLLFVLTHPAIDVAARAPLMLQTVLGLDAARIASAFLVQPATMGQRLTRAKAKIREAGIAFDLPQAKELPGRLESVLDAIYAAYGSGWEDVACADPKRRDLAQEAIALGTLLAQLLPKEAEVLGLVALMLHCDARRQARRDDAHAYVPLNEQDVQRWDPGMMAAAESYLAQASRFNRMGRFQLEAAIQSVHAQRAQTGRTDWQAIALLYEGLVQLAPSIGALVGRAASLAQARDAAVAWSLLQQLPPEAVATYQPYWALAAHLLGNLGDRDGAQAAYDRAIGLSEDPAMRNFLMSKKSRG